MDFKEEKIHTHKERKALQNKEPYLRANIRSYLLTKRKKNWKINVYIFVLNKKQNRDIKPERKRGRSNEHASLEKQNTHKHWNMYS